MQLSVKGKQMDVGDALRTHVADTLDEVATKYFSDPLDANVVFSREAHLFKCDMTIHVGKGTQLQASAGAGEPYPAFDMAMDKLAKRLRRHKRRLRDHNAAANSAATDAILAQYNVIGSADTDTAETGESEDGAPIVVADMTKRLETLAVPDAVMRLELSDAPAMMFRNPSHGGLNMIYRRPDGNIGWVDPVGNEDKAG